MKQFFSYLGASLAAIAALASCNKELEAPVEDLKGGVPFEICASTADTKTAIDGFATSWVADDAINLFHAVAGTTDYTSDGQFTITAENLDANKFTGTLNGDLTAKSYDWYAIYPYKEQISSPANQTDGYVYIGRSDDIYQNGNDSKAHLCGSPCPLYGVSKSIDASSPVSLEMKHLASVVEINVTNSNDEPLKVSSISFSTGEDIVGSYYINFAGQTVVYNPSNANHVKTVANLTVKNGTALAKGKTASFYIPIKPHVAENGSVITITVNGYEKTISLTKDVTFTAGKIKKVNFDFDKVQTTYTWDLSVVSTTVATAEELAWTNDVADMVCAKGESTTATNNYYPGVGQKSTRFYKNSTLSITPKSGKSLTYFVFEATTEGYASALANSNWTNAEVVVEGTTVTVIANDPAVAVSAVIGANCGFTKVECHTDAAPVLPPVISVTQASFNIAAAGEVCTVKYTIKNPVDGKVISAISDQTWVNTFDCSKDGEVSFIVDENKEDARTATVTLSYEGAENLLINVSQNGVSTGSGLGAPYSWTLASGDLGTTGSPLSTVSKGSPELSWTASYGWPNGANKFFGWDANTSKGVQVGSGSSTNKCNSLVLSSSKYSGSVKTIVVNGSIAKSGNTVVTVQVNGTTFKCDTKESVSLTTTASNYTFTSDTPVEGIIEIKFTNSVAKAFYLKSISINPAE